LLQREINVPKTLRLSVRNENQGCALSVRETRRKLRQRSPLIENPGQLQMNRDGGSGLFPTSFLLSRMKEIL